MNLRPLNDRVIVKRDDVASTTDSGIILTDTAKEKPSRGIVIAKGKEAKEVEVGDNVMFESCFQTELESNYVVMREEHIIAVIG